MSDNSDSDNSAKFQVFNFIRSKIPYIPVLQDLRRKGNTECLYRQNLNGISDSDSNSDSDMSLVQQQISVRRDRCLKRINTSAAGVAYSGPAYDSLSSKDVTELSSMPLNGIRSRLVGRRCRQRLRSVIATKWEQTCRTCLA